VGSQGGEHRERICVNLADEGATVAVEHHSRVNAARADLKTSYVRHDLGDQGTQLLL
jgi:hypothetical protein